ncbi:MAG: amidohydrolase family protein, partial [Ensifer adhaerens]
AYTVQMGPYFEGAAIADANGTAVAAVSPPTRLAIDKGLLVAGGTDSTRIGVAGVWQAIEYHLTGRSLGGTVQKASDQLLTREEALRLYTRNAAWIAFAEEDRGTLSAGKLADLAVLDKPYMTMPVDEIDTIRSVLTLLGGKVVYDAGALRSAEQ